MAAAYLSPFTGRVWSRISDVSPKQPLVLTGGRLLNHVRNGWMLSAERYLSRELFGKMLSITAALPLLDSERWRNDDPLVRESSKGNKRQQGGRLRRKEDQKGQRDAPNEPRSHPRKAKEPWV